MDVECRQCHALFWKAEVPSAKQDAFQMCCKQGGVISDIPNLPEAGSGYIRRLFTANDADPSSSGSTAVRSMLH
ncbi:uncharacterized protein N7515_004953 [Penicillium bovifimosum]|uniref:Uncharacterized protein n=1 Tax=Penicillium bovifimosum TaxID=126998 RepID=A0A9W9L2X0_9EURO|nr:uncharacterized protein N7515_004953 [Penicillium bovifimosum]KAJ5135675.1 hypothetical protein N7515_004953 [Penicillium bovifimosum]